MKLRSTIHDLRASAQEHVQAVIDLIQARIGKLQQTIDQLRELLNEDQVDGTERRPPARRVSATVAAPSGTGTHRKPAARLGAQASRLPRKLKGIDAIREVFRKSVGELSSITVRDQILRLHPHLEDRLSSVSVNLIDMSNRGELHRTGKGREATYRKAKLKEPKNDISSKETAWRQFRESIPAPSTVES